VNVAETLLVFVGAPLAVIVVLALLVYLPAGRNRRPRYKPGQPWEHAPIWYEPHPEHGPDAGHGAGHGETLAIGSSIYGEPQGSDHAAGLDSHGATPARVVNAGPLGGARGTW
jgi:hypothetical protein